MNQDDQTTSIESASELREEEDYDGTKPLRHPALEIVAQFFAAPSQFRQFSSVASLAEYLTVSRMTIYRWVKDINVVVRIEWLLRRSMRSGDLIAAREWRAIMEAQVRAALAGDTRAAEFCLKRAWRQTSIFGEVTIEPSIGGADALALWRKKREQIISGRRTGAQ